MENAPLILVINFMFSNLVKIILLTDELVLWEAQGQEFTFFNFVIALHGIYIIYGFAFGLARGPESDYVEPTKTPTHKKWRGF